MHWTSGSSSSTPTAAIVGWNDWIAGTSGVGRQSAIGPALFSVFPDLQQTRLADRDQRCGAVRKLQHPDSYAEQAVAPAAPRRKHSASQHRRQTGPSGTTAFCLLQVTDVTVAVTRERVLRERQNARYRAIVDSARDAIITIDINARINWVNDAAEAAFGYAPSELLGKPIDLLLDPVEKAGEQLRGPSADGRSGFIQVSGRRKSGELAHFAVSVGRWKADERVFTTTIWRDITERLAVEAAMRESESRYRALLEALPQLVWTCAPDGNCDYVNPRWQEYMGLRRISTTAGPGLTLSTPTIA